ncbi:MAG: FkbM family methyltransferase [Microgenomates group bacterium]|jgi:FkbM family methyltransferase
MAKRSKTDENTSAAPKSDAELKAEIFLRRQKRNMRKASAEGFLTGVCAMLRPGDLVMDCGANMGVVTAVLAATGADVIAYEPDPFAFATLQEKFAAMPNVSLVQAAVGVGAGTVRLMRADNFDTNPNGASVKSTILDGGRRIDADNSVEVPLIDFPALVQETVARRGQIAFVKMDIEGAELQILEKMDEADLFQHVRCLVAETHERKFRDLVPRYKAIRAIVAKKYSTSKVNLEWI